VTPRNCTILALIGTAALSRLLPHPPNMTSVAATALFAGAFLRTRWAAFLVPLAALLLSDIILHFTSGWAAFGWFRTPTIYLTFVAAVIMGRYVSRDNIPRSIGLGTASLLLFFLTTNFAAWLALPEYPNTLTGLAACYTAAIPFALNSVAGMLLFSSILFGSMAFGEARFQALRQEPLTA